ncbi:Tripartite motif-containing protein 29 [Dissostichus eleginoides]|uniref:Tripartite motif-containing protein 29 n=1 Tax=Dissostichus eleginoides TaxID=100907 RepID=A0AAD9BSZ4_DISEL|nr:Tripartite motif-containing protein 29 [Dissostichus eleginoides]
MSVNRVLAEISSQFQGLMLAGGSGGGGSGGSSRGSTLNLSSDTSHGSPSSTDNGEFARAGEVPCDACIGRKVKALKSCLNCPGSFCEVHLRHHKKVKSLTSHRLIEPTFHLEEKICKKHERLLEIYCRSDHTCICTACAEASHKSHDLVSAEHEWKKKMSNLGKKRSELKHLIKERTKKLDEIKQSIKVIKASSQKELEESWQVYAELQRLVEQSQAELVELIAKRQREGERHAQELARGLENELSQLRSRSNELEAYAHTQDKVLFLQNLATLTPPPEPTDWSAVSINTDLYLGTIRSSVSGLVDKFHEELKRLYGKELRKVQNYSSEVILDPATAQRNLVVSEDGRQVRYEERKTSHTEGPKRFSPALFVLGREGLTSGRHYWEETKIPLYQCPMCKKSFCKRPDISINTVLREIAEQFKEIRVRSAEEKVSEEVEGVREKKWTMERKKKEDEERLLEEEQKQDVREEQEEVRSKEEKKLLPEDLPPLIPPAQLKMTEIDIQQMIQEREKKLHEIKLSVEENKASAQREVEESMQVVSELVRSIHKTQGELSFPALSTPPSVKDWSETSVPTAMCVGMIRRSLSKLEVALKEMIRKLAESGTISFNIEIQTLSVFV